MYLSYNLALYLSFESEMSFRSTRNGSRNFGLETEVGEKGFCFLLPQRWAHLRASLPQMLWDAHVLGPSKSVRLCAFRRDQGSSAGSQRKGQDLEGWWSVWNQTKITQRHAKIAKMTGLAECTRSGSPIFFHRSAKNFVKTYKGLLYRLLPSAVDVNWKILRDDGQSEIKQKSLKDMQKKKKPKWQV